METEQRNSFEARFQFLGLILFLSDCRPSFSAHNSQLQAGVAISCDTPCSTWMRELARHCLVPLFLALRNSWPVAVCHMIRGRDGGAVVG
jgi:hypothetical protein